MELVMIGKKILHYKILEKLGQGGMGVVYLAEDENLERKVAIKFLPQQISANSEERERFKIEAKAAASLNHPNIATIHAIEDFENQLFIVMEYIDGVELKEKIKSGDIDTDEVIKIATQIAEGMASAHKKGIIHRDIKSSNIMITKEAKAKIMDFGLAKIRGGTELTKVGSTVGTIAYMSPEQARGEELDQQSDIWSFGVVLYEMLINRLPFRGDYDQAIVYSILNEEPESVFSVKKDIPDRLEKIVKKLLEKDKANRYQNMNNVIKDFNDVLKNDEQPEKRNELKSIIVLPFENISPDQDADYFGEGLAEELIVNLTRLKEIRVVPRTTAIKYKNTTKEVKVIGKEVEAGYVMTGSVRKFQDNLRISVQLIDAFNNTQLWAETYKGKLADVFDIQENVSKQIVDALKIELTPAQKRVLEKKATINAEAFDLCLRAKGFMYRMTKNDVNIAIELFQKAIEIDPDYASAYAGMGEAYSHLFHSYERGNPKILDLAIETSLKAISMDSSLSEAFASLAQAYLHKDSMEKALEAGKKAIELDPNNFIGFWILGRIYYSNKKDVEAIELFDKVTKLNPEFYTAYSDIRMCYDRLGDKIKLNETVQKSLKFYPEYLTRHPDDARAHVFYAMDLATAKQFDKAKSETAKAIELNPTDILMLYNVACFYSVMDEKQMAIETLKKAITAGYKAYDWMERDVDLDNIRNEPEYIELMKGK
jgi:serine/threonine protein kinase/Flp pilus assembly protein TadD